MLNLINRTLKDTKKLCRSISYAAGTIIERRPDIWMDLEPWEVKYNSYDECKEVRIGKGDIPSNIMNSDDEINHFPDFQVGNKLTKYDVNKYNNTDLTKNTSIKRKLQDKMYFIVQNKLTNEWQFPYDDVEDIEIVNDLQQVSYKDILNTAGTELTIWYPGKAPIGVLNDNDKDIFYFFCNFIDGDIELDTNKYKNYAWVTKDELINEYFIDQHGKQTQLGILCQDILVKLFN